MNFDQIAVVKLASEGAAEAIAVGLRLEGFANPVVVCSEKTAENAQRLSRFLSGEIPLTHRHRWVDGLEKMVPQSSAPLMTIHLQQRKSYRPSDSLVVVVGSPEAYVWCVQEISEHWHGKLEDDLDQAVFTHAQARQVCA